MFIVHQLSACWLYGTDSVLTGSPTPRVTWRRVESLLVEGAGRVYSDSFGQELVFTDVDFPDQGTYECTAENTQSGQPRATHKTQLVVECKLIQFSSLFTYACMKGKDSVLFNTECLIWSDSLDSQAACNQSNELICRLPLLFT